MTAPDETPDPIHYVPVEDPKLGRVWWPEGQRPWLPAGDAPLKRSYRRHWLARLMRRLRGGR